MGYIKNMYGEQSVDFVKGFIAAIDTYAFYRNGKRWIGSPEKIAREAAVNAITELGHNPEDFEEI